MDAATLAAICMLHAQNPGAYPLPPSLVTCAATGSARPRAGASVSVHAARVDHTGLEPLRAVVSTPEARDAMARTVTAEAGNQGDSGMAGVVYTILNRLSDGRWGSTVEAVVDAPGQFEPVMRAGGSWRGLRPVSEAQQARVSTIVNLALDGRLPDLTGGARYFQNPQIVAARARAGAVSAGLVNFGGATPSAVIGAHAFYVAAGHMGGAGRRHRSAAMGVRVRPTASEIFVGDNRVADVLRVRADVLRAADTAAHTDGPSRADGGIFVAD